MGEPFPSQAEMGGFGRVLFQAREYWPDYMSCILVVRQDLIDQPPGSGAGCWSTASRAPACGSRRASRTAKTPPISSAASTTTRSPALLRWALTKPMDRVMYSPLAPRKADFDMVRDLMIETGVLDKKIEFEEYTDTRFADNASIQTAWKYEPGGTAAR